MTNRDKIKLLGRAIKVIAKAVFVQYPLLLVSMIVYPVDEELGEDLIAAAGMTRDG